MNASIKLLLVLSILLTAGESGAQDVYKLWEGKTKPYYKENNLKEYEEEFWNTMCVFNITEPTLTVYEAEDVNSGKAVVIFPGGGYSLVAMYHEGHDLARVLAKEGITAAVLKYRLPDQESSDKPELVPITDARRAIKLMRSLVDKYDFNKDEVGVIGFSAGSHLAAAASLWVSDDDEENPDFSGHIYGPHNLSEANKKWLEESLYYRKMTDEEIKKNSLPELITAETLPSFLVHAYDDDAVPVEGTTLYAQKLYEHNVPVEVHLFPKGGHGFGMGREETGTTQWVQLFINWVKSL